MDATDKADELCGELFSWIDQQEKCAKHLKNLADELEEITEIKRKRQLKYNSLNASISFGLAIAGIAGLVLVGLPSLSLWLLGSSTLGISSMKLLSDKIVKKWKSSEVRKIALMSANEIEQIWNNTEKLLMKLSEECEIQGLKASTSDEVQCEITARILKAMAKKHGKDLSLNYLRHLLRNNDVASQIDLNPTFFQHISFLLTVLGHSFSLLKTMTQTSQNIEGFLGRMVTVSDWINNCEKLIKNNDQQEASNFLRTKAKDMCESMMKLKMHLNDIQETLYQMECHIDLQEMVGSQIYTQGTMYVEYKQAKVEIEKFIIICSKDLKNTCNSSNKNKTHNNVKNTQKSTMYDQVVYYEQFHNSDQVNPLHLFYRFMAYQQVYQTFPLITMSNVRSLQNKMMRLTELVLNHQLYNRSDCIFFTETWLNDRSDDVTLNEHYSFRVDRDAYLTGKTVGGGMIAYLRNYWVAGINFELSYWVNTPIYELMCLSVIPVATWNIPQINFIQVYVHGQNQMRETAIEIAQIYEDLRWPYELSSAPCFLLGDFNNCDVAPFLHFVDQYVTCPTRRNRILDKCYGNVRDTYTCFCSRPLDGSDHNVIHLIPRDRLAHPFYTCNHNDVQNGQ